MSSRILTVRNTGGQRGKSRGAAGDAPGVCTHKAHQAGCERVIDGHVWLGSSAVLSRNPHARIGAANLGA
jgi:hypothetical protein